MASKHEYIGVPAFGGGIHKEENDPRRHKARCVHNDGKTCKCSASPYFGYKCGGSSHCANYMEAFNTISDSEDLDVKKPIGKENRVNQSQCDPCMKRTGRVCKMHSRKIPFEIESNKIECPYRSIAK